MLEGPGWGCACDSTACTHKWRDPCLEKRGAIGLQVADVMAASACLWVPRSCSEGKVGSLGDRGGPPWRSRGESELGGFFQRIPFVVDPSDHTHTHRATRKPGLDDICGDAEIEMLVARLPDPIAGPSFRGQWLSEEGGEVKPSLPAQHWLHFLGKGQSIAWGPAHITPLEVFRCPEEGPRQAEGPARGGVSRPCLPACRVDLSSRQSAWPPEGGESARDKSVFGVQPCQVRRRNRSAGHPPLEG